MSTPTPDEDVANLLRWSVDQLGLTSVEIANQAADEIERLRAENARMADALRSLE